ncbi:MAG: CDP-alcohol phosphatidyltransferase family protein [Clostridia bacterium]|nr:CDP-alcohol phosphatidyltransferase family protein [Clostridia bacterium]
MCYKKNLPNIITLLRFFGTLCILFLAPLKPPFFMVYTATGITELFDGYIARKMNLTSAFGAKLDSIADLLFYTVSLIKLLPTLIKNLPHFIWIIVALILILRTLSYIIAAIKFRRFASHHTWLNKITGLFVFAIPYLLVTPFSVPFCFSVCMMGVLSTAEDLYIHISSKEYDDNIKSALKIR